MIATQSKSRQILGVNQQSYQLLKASLGLNLRRQLLIAVCDSVVMQNQLATQLEADLARERALPSISEADDFEGLAPSFLSKKAIARLVFDPEDGNLPKQVAQWVRQTILAEGTLPQVQVLGIEQMTRQPAITQNHFLRSLEKVDALLPRINTSLLIWVPWPWLRTIQQSAPIFWNWRNGVFEFVSDPTPVGQQALKPSSDEPIYADASPQNTAYKESEFETELVPSATADDLYQDDDYPNSDDADPNQIDISTPQSALAEDDDLSSLFEEPALEKSAAAAALLENSLQNESADLYGETGKDEQITDKERDAQNDAVPLAPKPTHSFKRSSARRRSLAALSGLTSVVTKGVNADSKPASNQHSQPENNNLEKAFVNTHRSAEGASNEANSETNPLPDAIAPATHTQQPTEEPSNQQLSEEQPVEEQPVEDYLAAGRACRARIEAGERGLGVIEAAIAAYENGLRYLSGASPEWSVGLNDLGTLYWLKAQQGEDPKQGIENMTHSVELYEDALKRLKPSQSELIGQLYSNMGAVYSMIATYQDSADYLNQAIDAYRQALPTCSLENDPQEYATLHNSLGSVYWKLSHYEQVQSNLHKAIAAYSAALSGYLPNAQPLDYAAVQNNLGITYWSLAKHEKPQFFLKQAIAAYSDALNYRTPESDPAACAITYNNLALAYWDLSKSEDLEQMRRAQAQKNAVTAFEAALNISRTANVLSSMDSTAIYHCLGDVHGQMAETAPSLVEVKERLGKSLYSYIQSLRGVSEASPVYQARIGAIVANLRSHYTHLGLEGQQSALSKVPADLIAQVLAAL